jgi:hypothetical protein
LFRGHCLATSLHATIKIKKAVFPQAPFYTVITKLWLWDDYSAYLLERNDSFDILLRGRVKVETIKNKIKITACILVAIKKELLGFHTLSSSSILKVENTTFRKLDLFLSSSE